MGETGRPQTRRERQHAATREEIKAVARELLRTEGAAGVSLGAVARGVGVVPSALYRYFDNHGALVTSLIVDAAEGLGETLRAGPDSPDPVARLDGVAHAFRSWALSRPTDFALLFGTPIPGYHAPMAETGPPLQRALAVFLEVFRLAEEQGVLRPPAGYRPEIVATPAIGPRLVGWSPLVVHCGTACWTVLHGVLSLELAGHLRGTVAEPDAFFATQVRLFAGAVGLAGPAG